MASVRKILVGKALDGGQLAEPSAVISIVQKRVGIEDADQARDTKGNPPT